MGTIKKMNKLLAFLSAAFSYLFIQAKVFAQNDIPDQLDIRPAQPGGLGIAGNATIGGLLTNALTIIYIIAVLLALFFLILGAFNWIASGGDKEKLTGARKTITSALVGLVILALAFVIVKVVGQLLNIDITELPTLPRLGPPPK